MIRIDESDCLSAASSHDMETEHFLSTGTTGRRVSFNEAALFDHSKKTQEKGRRYTLTEGDFHHLKNARLTHLHLPPPALQILTIHECESSENSIAMTARPVAKSSLSIFQTALTSRSLSPSSALPGDALNSTVDTTFCESITAAGPEPSSPEGASASSTALSSSGGAPQGPMLQFFTKLRRHASLEGASPYFKIKKWKFDSSQRASSLDMRDSPKRRQFQRQRAASESMDQEEHDAHHIDLIQYIARTKDVTYCPTRPSSRLLSPPSTPPPSLGRLEVEVMVEPSCSRAMGPGVIGLTSEPPDESLGMGYHQESLEPQTLYRDIWTLRASLERYAYSDQSSNNDKDSVRSDADSVCALGGRKQDSVDSERGSDGEPGNRKLLQMDSGYASIEAPSRAPEDTMLWSPYGQMFAQRDAQPHPPILSCRDYSIDEKTDALFHEFLRHDPQFDQQESPLRSKHRSRVHLRKQWQRSKQCSDPGQQTKSSGGATSTPETPKADQDTATDLDPDIIRISSSTESSGTINEKEVLETSQPPPMTDIAGEQSVGQENSRQTLPPPEPPDERTPKYTSYGPQTITEELSDKLAATLEERLYSDLRRTREPPECSAVTVTYTSPDHSPV
uniref:Voltage-dependent calcium channel beta subunit-associated regulatory protein-like n=1 Tax=Sinocyclocheilus anshuiensis TaxID=1608454 RepID=A0A671SJT6_9TELE